MLGVPLDTRVRRTLGVEVGAELALGFTVIPTPYFPAHLTPAQGVPASLDGSPRTSLPSQTLYWQGAFAPLRASDRYENLDETVYEVISQPMEVTNGRSVVGYSAAVLPVSLLYPRSAVLKANAEDDEIATVECSIFSERESKTQRGAYHDDFAEFPPSVWQYIDGAQNLELHFDDEVWKITEASLSREVPYVTAAVRRV